MSDEKFLLIVGFGINAFGIGLLLIVLLQYLYLHLIG
tara:strand:- start:2111 stop:2221 length:111 start_codon:yes stop_codon:yes gene_type:complete